MTAAEPTERRYRIAAPQASGRGERERPDTIFRDMCLNLDQDATGLAILDARQAPGWELHVDDRAANGDDCAARGLIQAGLCRKRLRHDFRPHVPAQNTTRFPQRRFLLKRGALPSLLGEDISARCRIVHQFGHRWRRHPGRARTCREPVDPGRPP